MTPFQEALLAIEMLVDALHTTAQASPEAEFAAGKAFAAVRHLGFDTRRSTERASKPPRTWSERATPVTQRTLFPT